MTLIFAGDSLKLREVGSGTLSSQEPHAHLPSWHQGVLTEPVVGSSGGGTQLHISTACFPASWLNFMALPLEFLETILETLREGGNGLNIYKIRFTLCQKHFFPAAKSPHYAVSPTPGERV